MIRETVGALDDETERKAFEVFPENWTSFLVFVAMQTQWKLVAGMGGAVYMGLDYAGVKAALEALELPDRGDLFADIQTMERAALKELNKRKPKGKA